MSDITVQDLAQELRLIGTTQKAILEKFKDMGDGTFARLVALASSGVAGTPSAAVDSVQGVAGGVPVTVGGLTTIPAASAMTRPADTSAYASGDLIANSTTAASVAALSFSAARLSGGSGAVVGARVQKSGTTVTNCAMRLHLFSVVPTFTSAGDNTALSSVVQASAKGYLGYIDVPAFVGFQDCAWGTGAADNGRPGIPFVAAAQTLYGVLEARGAYTPASAEVFTASLMVYQD